MWPSRSARGKSSPWCRNSCRSSIDDDGGGGVRGSSWPGSSRPSMSFAMARGQAADGRQNLRDAVPGGEHDGGSGRVARMKNPARILAVDDVPANLDIVRMRLEAQGYEIVTAADGEEALAQARKL